jgi:hypothetical protein
MMQLWMSVMKFVLLQSCWFWVVIFFKLSAIFLSITQNWICSAWQGGQQLAMICSKEAMVK